LNAKVSIGVRLALPYCCSGNAVYIAFSAVLCYCGALQCW